MPRRPPSPPPFPPPPLSRSRDLRRGRCPDPPYPTTPSTCGRQCAVRAPSPSARIDLPRGVGVLSGNPLAAVAMLTRSEEHTSELQSRLHLVCRLLLEKKKET